MRLALAQLDPRLGDVDANARRLEETLAEARAGGADLVVFPELFLSGYALRGADPRATARSAAEVAALAAAGPAALVGFREGAHNSAAYVEGGAVVHLQRKVQLVDYPPFDEHELFAPGDGVRAFETALGRFAVLICNDAWYPLLASLAVEDGAQVLLVPTASSDAVPEAERYWRELTRFYARMLQCYVVFANRVGTEAGLTFWGGSHVVDPCGELVAEAPRLAETILLADLDVERVEERRRELPIVARPGGGLRATELARLVRKG